MSDCRASIGLDCMSERRRSILACSTIAPGGFDFGAKNSPWQFQWCAGRCRLAAVWGDGLFISRRHDGSIRSVGSVCWLGTMSVRTENRRAKRLVFTGWSESGKGVLKGDPSRAIPGMVAFWNHVWRSGRIQALNDFPRG